MQGRVRSFSTMAVAAALLRGVDFGGVASSNAAPPPALARFATCACDAAALASARHLAALLLGALGGVVGGFQTEMQGR